MILTKKAVDELMYEFTIWMWQHDLKVTEDEIEDFFRASGITRHEAVASANLHGIVITSAEIEDKPKVGWDRFVNWVFT